jgi:hypothetical protein
VTSRPWKMRQVGGCCHYANRKGRDIGYVPAICSCEGAYSVDPCTVAALDAIAAFAVPNPSSSSQSQPVFSGLVAPSGRPDEQITQPTSDQQGLFRQSFQPSTEDKLNSCSNEVNAIIAVNTRFL